VCSGGAAKLPVDGMRLRGRDDQTGDIGHLLWSDIAIVGRRIGRATVAGKTLMG
jgi:hypothetical protein